MKNAQELTSVSFWDSHWKGTQHEQHPYSGYAGRVWTLIFDQTFASAQPGETCIEVGCADSYHLPHLAQHYKLAVSGLDYSVDGCELARASLRKAGVPGNIYQCDLFEPKKQLLGQFDFAVSFGVIEHFQDPSTAISAIKLLLKPGGRILTTTPNVNAQSLNVCVQRIVGPKTLAMHKLMNLSELKQFHEKSGFKTLQCGYTGMGLCLACDDDGATKRFISQISYRTVQVARKCFEIVKCTPPGKRFTGLYMVYIGQA